MGGDGTVPRMAVEGAFPGASSALPSAAAANGRIARPSTNLDDGLPAGRKAWDPRLRGTSS